jgi:hypothetical protein
MVRLNGGCKKLTRPALGKRLSRFERSCAVPRGAAGPETPLTDGSAIRRGVPLIAAARGVVRTDLKAAFHVR